MSYFLRRERLLQIAGFPTWVPPHVRKLPSLEGRVAKVAHAELNVSKREVERVT